MSEERDEGTEVDRRPGSLTRNRPGGSSEIAKAAAANDPRIAGVMDVIAGAELEEAAQAHGLDPMLLERWTAMFVAGGSSQVENRPSVEIAAHRDRFLAAFAFEMRSPLTMAMGWVDLMLNDQLPEAAKEMTAKRLQDALGELSERVGDVELLVAAALGGLEIKKEKTTVGQVCDIEGLVGVEGTGPATEIEVDVDLFRRIIRDLWDAAAIEPMPTLRRIRASIDGPWTEIAVVRHGGEIDTDLLQVLFEPFQADHIGSGVTIGLYLARALTVAHGGQVGIDQDDNTTTFWVRVPRPPEVRTLRGSSIPAPESD